MFKRTNKTLATLMAAAAVVAIIPTGVSAATKETDSQNGDIYSAVAYKDGTFYIGGEPSKKDEAAYYLNNGKYNELDDIDSDDDVEVYGTKYVDVENGDYYLDLSTGKVTDDNIKDQEMDNVAISLRGKVKADNDGRYDEDDAKEIKDLTELPKAKFADGWYEVDYSADSADNEINGGASSFNVYTDSKGKYIDADHNLGKVKVKLSNGNSATISNTSDEDDDVRGKVTNAKVIGQDSSNIYRLATITITAPSGVTITEANGIALSDATTGFTLSSDKTSVSFEAIQVISKAQASGEVDGIKYAKTVTNYALSDKKGVEIDLLSTDASAFTVADGVLVNYKVDGDTIEAQTITLKDKSSTYYVEQGDSDDVELQDGVNSVDIDSEGNLWALSDESLFKFDNDEDFEEMYEMDEEYTDVSVYDDENLIVWSTDDDSYAIISKKAATDEDTGSNTGNGTTTPGADNGKKVGWIIANGKWSYYNENGTSFKGWLKDGNAWYYLDTDGTMSTGWKSINNKWYYLAGSGAMQTGWLNDGGTWYYLNANGEMLANTTINGYKLGANGAWVK